MKFGAGERIGRFLIEEAVAGGGFSVVYRAKDPRLDQDVAIKVLAENHSFDPGLRTRFAEEARALRAVDSSSVVTVFDLGETDSGQPYLVMSYAERGTLAERLDRAGSLGRHDLGRLASFLAESLGAMHKASLIHRDVKPSNILITAGRRGPTAADSILLADDHLLLADFGLVKDLAAGSGYTAEAGSAGYASPEQTTLGSRVDARSDVYGASAVMARALTGKPAGTGTGWVDDLARSPHRGLAAAIAKGLDHDPDKRQESMAAWRTEVLSGLAEWGRAPRSTGPRSSGRARLLAGLAAGALIAALVGLWATRLGEPGTTDDGTAIGSFSQTTESSTDTGPVDTEPDDTGPDDTGPDATSSGGEPDTAVPPPTDLTAEATGDSIRLTWTLPPGSTGANLYRYDNGLSRRSWLDWVPAGRQSYQLYRLDPETEYTFGFEAFVDGIDEGSGEVTVAATTGTGSALDDGGEGTALRSFRSERCAVVSGQGDVLQEDCDSSRVESRWDVAIEPDGTVTFVSRADQRCLRRPDDPEQAFDRPILLIVGACDQAAARFTPQLNETQGVHVLQLADDEIDDAAGEPWCLDVLGGAEETGTPVAVFTCNTAINQRWVINGL